MVKKKVLLVLLVIAGVTSTRAQHIAINNNILFDLMGALSAGVEIPLSNVSSVEMYGSVRPWKRGNTTVHKHWLAEAQYRYWPCQVMNGFFFGPYVHGGEYNFGGQALLFTLLKGLKQNRYEGWLIGGGIGAGYEYALAKHWNIGAEIGVGYTYLNYKKTDCEECGTFYGRDDYHYIGISKLGLTVSYVF
jgi:opacity protein-like surface antigen